MTVRGAINHLIHQPQDAFYYWQGILRYWVYKRPALRWLIRWHIREQYEQRKREAYICYDNGECICCGCRTPELYFADKACPAGRPKYWHCLEVVPCYPALMNQQDWYWHQSKRANHVSAANLPAG